MEGVDTSDGEVSDEIHATIRLLVGRIMSAFFMVDLELTCT